MSRAKTSLDNKIGAGAIALTLVLSSSALWGGVQENEAPKDEAPQEGGTAEEGEGASPPSPGQAKGLVLPPLQLDFDATVQTLVYFKNDTDFDRSEPIYDVEGQTMGIAGTLFGPRFTLDAGELVRLYYEAELGINTWSKNNPDQQDPTAPDIFLLKHRELWTKVKIGRNLAIKAGYERFIDPSGLFYNHWMGVASFLLEVRKMVFTFSVGQLPDGTFEGVRFQENNFKHDTFMVAARLDFDGSRLDASGGVFGLVDASIVGKPNVVIMPCISLSYRIGAFLGRVAAAFQGGVMHNTTLTGGSDINLGWAIEASGRYEVAGVVMNMNLLLLSPDDDYEGGGINSAFYYSGKNRSLTRLLTENEVRDLYDNYDEEIATKDGPFFLTRPGMALVDLSVHRTFLEFLQPGVTVATFTVMNPDNALGHVWGGLEVALMLDLLFAPGIALRTAAGLLVPGKALSAVVNRIDLQATDPIFMMAAILDVQIS